MIGGATRNFSCFRNAAFGDIVPYARERLSQLRAGK
jgi:hypothetical protein